MTANSWRTCAIAAEESRCFASSDTSGANRTAPEEEDGLTTPGPGPRERERGRHRGMCVVPSSCKRGGLLQWFAVFTANTATPSFRVTPPQPRWTFAAASLFPKDSQKSNYTRTHTESCLRTVSAARVSEEFQESPVGLRREWVERSDTVEMTLHFEHLLANNSQRGFENNKDKAGALWTLTVSPKACSFSEF